MKLGKKNRILVGLAAFLFAGMANAIPVTWTLNNVVFDDGGTASGTFVYDADTNIYSGVNVATTTGSVLSGSEYLECGPFPGCNVMAATQTLFWPLNAAGSGSPVFELQFDNALTNAGGVVGLTENIDYGSCGYTYGASNEFDGSGTCRFLVSGTVSAVPVPAAAWLFASALAGLGWLRRKQAA